MDIIDERRQVDGTIHGVVADQSFNSMIESSYEVILPGLTNISQRQPRIRGRSAGVRELVWVPFVINAVFLSVPCHFGALHVLPLVQWVAGVACASIVQGAVRYSFLPSAPSLL